MLSGLRDDKHELQNQINTLTDDKNALHEKLNAAGEFDAQMSPRILHDALAGKSVVVFRTPDANDDDVDALSRMVAQAGGTVTGAVALTQEFVDANSAEKLLSVVNSPIVPAGAQLSTTSVDQGSQAGDLLGIALLINKDPKVQVVDDAQRDTVLAALRDTGFVTYGTQRIGAANTALIVTGGGLSEGAGNQGATVARFAAGLAPHGSGTVVVGARRLRVRYRRGGRDQVRRRTERRGQHSRRRRRRVRPNHDDAGAERPDQRRAARSIRRRPGRVIGNTAAIVPASGWAPAWERSSPAWRVSDGLSVSVLGWGSVGRQAPS